MSISLNNHESRIKALENKSGLTAVSVTALFKYNGGLNGGNVVLSQAYTNFDILEIRGSSDNTADGIYSHFCIPKMINTGNVFKLWCDDTRYWTVRVGSSTQFNVVQENARIHSIIGIKFRDISYNILNIIRYGLLREVI